MNLSRTWKRGKNLSPLLYSLYSYVSREFSRGRLANKQGDRRKREREREEKKARSERLIKAVSRSSLGVDSQGGRFETGRL